MKFSTIAMAAASTALTASASPVEKRAYGGVLLCTGVNRTGECKYDTYPLQTCIQLEEPFYQNSNTFAVDGEDFYCLPKALDCDEICKSPTGCTFGKVDFNYENKYNLSTIGWDKFIHSFECFKERGQ